MKLPRRILGLMLAVVFAAGVPVAHAQSALMIDTSFAFRLGPTTFQPGHYELRIKNEEGVLTVTPTKGVSSVASVLTRLAPPETLIVDGKVVFDKVGDLYYLSEVWIPGWDGYLITSTKEQHTHVKVGGKKG